MRGADNSIVSSVVVVVTTVISRTIAACTLRNIVAISSTVGAS
jgi:hypothetical protein